MGNFFKQDFKSNVSSVVEFKQACSDLFVVPVLWVSGDLAVHFHSLFEL